MVLPKWRDLGSVRASPRRLYEVIKKSVDEIEAARYDDTVLSGRVTALEESSDGLQSITINIPADSAANDAIDTAIFVAPFDLDIDSILISPDGNIGQATDYMALFINEMKQEDGTQRQNAGNRSVNSVNTITKWQPIDIRVEQGSLSTVLAGNTLTFKKHPIEQGQAWPGGSVTINYTKNSQ